VLVLSVIIPSLMISRVLAPVLLPRRVLTPPARTLFPNWNEASGDANESNRRERTSELPHLISFATPRWDGHQRLRLQRHDRT
jgi:hypothetical protein